MVYNLTSEQKIWRYRIFAITWLGYAGFYLCRKNFSVVMPLLKDDFGYTKPDFAIVLFLYSLMYAIGQFYNGVLSDRFGPRLIVGIGLFISIFANVVMGFTISLFMFAILAAFNGAGQSSGWSGLVKNMTPWFRHSERGVVMAWWTTNYILGGFFATIFATFVATHPAILINLGWRRGFWIPSLLLFIIATLFISITRNKPGDAKLTPIVEDENSQSNSNRSSPTANEIDPQKSSKEIFLVIASNPVILITSFVYFFVKLTRYCFIFWLPMYMTEHLGYSTREAGFTSGLYELVGFTGALFAGFASDKLLGSRRFPVATVMLWGLALIFLCHPMLAAWGRLGTAIGIGLIGFATFGPDTLISGATAQDLGGQQGAATAAGFINGVGSFGSICSPFVVAYVAEIYGWDSLFYIFAILALIAGCLMSINWKYDSSSAPTHE